VIAEELKLPIYATPGTAEALQGLGIPATRLEKHDAPDSGMRAIEAGNIDLVINVPVEYDELGRPDGYMIRRGAVDAGIALITDLQLARAVVEALRHRTMNDLKTHSYDEFLARTRSDF
jgi:carbamoyl-phosphate synthase large subunit